MDDSENPSPAQHNSDVPDLPPDGEVSAGNSAESESAIVDASKREPYIKFDHVSKAFARPALVDCSFEVHRGEGLAILGTRGSGKSLILRLLMGFDQPDSGTIWVDGMRLDADDEVRQGIRKKIAVISQSGMVLEALTVAENVRGPLKVRGDLDDVQIDQVADGLLLMLGHLDGMDTLTPAELPLDKRRVLAIATALAGDPEAVVLDEPTENASPFVTDSLTRTIARLNKQVGLTFAISTNDLCLTRKLADKVLFVDRGTVVFEGTTEEFFASSEKTIQRYLRMESMY